MSWTCQRSHVIPGFTVLTTPLERLRTALADRYAVERELGAGGMATVYLATDLKHQRQVAIKVLRPELAATVGPERFVREIQIAARLQHPHVVGLLDSGVAGPGGEPPTTETAGGRRGSSAEYLYYVMPYVQGESLRERITRGPLPLSEAVRLLTEVADALAHAHGLGIVHRDIKPENIMLSGRHALVMDFGVARAVSEASSDARMTSAGFALGTPAYMAPEQAAGDPDVDARADIYAVGIVAYELLTGRLPYEAHTPQQLLAAHVTQPPEPITRFRSDLAPELAELVMRCLAKRREERWASADALRDALERLGPSGQSTPVQGTMPVQVGVSGQGHPVRVVVSFALIGAVVLAGVVFLVVQLGLPEWVVTGAIALLLAGLPIALATGRVERRRAAARATGTWHPSGETGLERFVTWRRMRRGGVAAFGGLGLAAAAYMAMRLLGIGPVGTLLASGRLQAQDKIVIADFMSRAGDSTLGPSVAEALRIDLGQSPLVQVLGATETKNGLQRMGRSPGARLDDATARELAVREGGKAYLVGEVTPAGRGFLFTARLLATEGDLELVALRETAADDGEVLTAIDRLSKHLRERLGESLKAIRAAPPLEQVTTSSLEALRLFTEARQLLRAGSSPRIEELLTQAVALDSGFAGAWRGLAVYYFNSGAPRSKQVDAATRAFLNRERLPELERSITEAYYYWSVTRDGEKAERAYRAVLARRPDDIASLNNLSLVYSRRREWSRAESLLTRGIAVDSNVRSFQVNLIETLARQQKLPEAKAAVDVLERRFPNAGMAIPSSRWSLAAMERRWDAVDSIARAAVSVGIGGVAEQAWPLETSAAARAVQGQITEAERLLRAAGEGGRRTAAHRVRYSTYLADLKAEYGLPAAEAVRIIDQALARDPLETIPVTDRPYGQLMFMYARLGRPERARELLAGFLAADTTVRRESQAVLGPEAWIELAEGKLGSSLAKLRVVADSDACTGCVEYYLARAYEQAGQPDSVIAILERVVNRPPDWEQFYDEATNLPRAYKRLGEFYEERGNRAKALDYYGRFAELWRNADPERQQTVRQVKDRMGRLAGE